MLIYKLVYENDTSMCHLQSKFIDLIFEVIRPKTFKLKPLKPERLSFQIRIAQFPIFGGLKSNHKT